MKQRKKDLIWEGHRCWQFSSTHHLRCWPPPHPPTRYSRYWGFKDGWETITDFMEKLSPFVISVTFSNYQKAQPTMVWPHCTHISQSWHKTRTRTGSHSPGPTSYIPTHTHCTRQLRCVTLQQNMEVLARTFSFKVFYTRNYFLVWSSELIIPTANFSFTGDPQRKMWI